MPAAEATMTRITGGCACGAVRYQAQAAPVFMLNCHCRDCQQATGGGYAAITVFSRTAVKLDGAPRYRTVVGESGKKVGRGFCPECGSPVCMTLEHIPDILGVHAGSLDDPALFKPAMDVFTSSAHAWDNMDPSLPKKPRGTRS
jgi:hypothetical protein